MQCTVNPVLDCTSIEDLCRLCASQYVNSESGCNSLSQDQVSSDLDLGLVEKYLKINLAINELLPQRICFQCTKKIQSFDEFSQRCHQVQELFFSMIEGLPLSEKHRVLLGKNSSALLKSRNNCVENSINSDGLPKKNEISVSEQIDTEGKKKKVKKCKLNIVTLKVPPLRIKAMKLKKEHTNLESGEISQMQYEIDDKQTRNSYSETEDIEDDYDNEDNDHSSDDFSIVRNSNETFESNKNLFNLFEFKCYVCSEIFKNFGTFKTHCKKEHNVSGYVNCVCGKQLRARNAILEHRRNHTGVSLYKCDTCSKTFNRKSLLVLHMISHKPKDEQPYVCCKCAKRFHTPSLLKKHEKVHLPEEERFLDICNICEKKFTSKSAVNAHLRAVHYGEKPFICEHCGNSFSSKAILTDHLTTHSSYAPWPCNVCGRNFKSKYRLNVHMDMHRSVKYTCPHCPMELSTRRTLRMHLLVHKEEKAYVCKVCSKAFRRSKDLKNHSNLHTGRRPYKCEFCERTFANGSNCRAHKLRMHSEELGVEKNFRSSKQPKMKNANPAPMMIPSSVAPPLPSVPVILPPIMPINLQVEENRLENLLPLTEIVDNPSPVVDYLKFDGKYEFPNATQDLDCSFDYSRYTTTLNLNVMKPTFMQQSIIRHTSDITRDTPNDISRVHFLYS